MEVIRAAPKKFGIGRRRIRAAFHRFSSRIGKDELDSAAISTALFSDGHAHDRIHRENEYAFLSFTLTLVHFIYTFIFRFIFQLFLCLSVLSSFCNYFHVLAKPIFSSFLI